MYTLYNAWPNIACRWPCGSMVDWTKGGDCASEAQCGELNAKYLRRLFAPLSLRSLSLCLSALCYTHCFAGAGTTSNCYSCSMSAGRSRSWQQRTRPHGQLLQYVTEQVSFVCHHSSYSHSI